MEAKNISDVITVLTVGLGVLALIALWLRTRLRASAKAAWESTPTLAGLLTFCIWFVILAGLGGVWVGGRYALYGAPNAIAQGKTK
jgi:hypothetical protein